MLPTDSIYVMIFLSGFLGGFGHCIGMCGPIVATYAVRLPGQSVRPHIFYNLGRITTYSLLGGIMGLTGSFAGVVKSIERFQNITLAAIGLLMILMGLSNMGLLPFPGKVKERKAIGTPRQGVQASPAPASSFSAVSSYLPRLINNITKAIVGVKGAGAFYPAGLALGFIPCGLLYTALIGAAGAGAESSNRVEGLFHGFLLLFLFGSGTAPALLILGGVVSRKGQWLRSRLCKASAFLMLLVGALYIYRAMSL